jgi:N-acetylglucosaminyldiphosphoundecaprenol N-acetyl-beta-D-mannosaminyltransferase
METSMHMEESIAGSMGQLQEENLMGVPVTCLSSYQDAVEHILSLIRKGESLSCVAINPMKVYSAWKDASLAHAIAGADLHICDGIGAALAVRLLHGRSICRVTGVQLFFHLIAAAERESLRVYLLGASPESNEMAYRGLQRRYPDLQVVGRHHGYFDNDESIVNAINAAEPEMLFVAMGSPRQEYWMAKHRKRLNVAFTMGVGGTFDVVSGNVKWAPAVFRRTGTEFLYRFCTQPRRFVNMVPLSRFALAVLNEFMRLRLAGR